MVSNTTDETDRTSTATRGTATENASDAMTRRRALRLGGVAGIGGVLGLSVAGLGATDAAADCDVPASVVHLDYDAADSWNDLYRLSNGRPENLALVSDPTNSGATALQLEVSEGGHWGASTHYEFTDGLFELAGRVSFALDTGWAMPGREVANCRLWNCAMSFGEGSAGGGVPDGTNGWSNRLYVTSRDADPDGPFHLLSDTYHMDGGSDGPDDHDYLVDGAANAVAAPAIEPGVWYEFEYYVRVNTITDGEANPDGVVRYWLDDDLIFEREDFRFTEDYGDNIIDSTGPAGHYGGRYVAPQNCYVYYDDHSMALGGPFEVDGC